MTSHIEALGSRGLWVDVSRIYPGKSSTFTNFNEGERDTLYSIACSSDDSSTRIYKRIPSLPGRFSGGKNIEFPSFPWEFVSVLKEGQVFNLPVTSQADGKEFQFRVVHRKEERSPLEFV